MEKLGQIVSRERGLTSPHSSCPAQAGHPVRRGLSAQAQRPLEYWVPAGACHRAALRADPVAGTTEERGAQATRYHLTARNISPLAKAAATGQKNRQTRNASGERVDHQGQGLHCRDL